MGLAIVLFFVVHAIEKHRTGTRPAAFVAQLDNIIYDARLSLTMPHGVDASIVILDIDERSLGEIGHWPWSRSLMADVVAKLFDRYGVGVLGFDVVWAERDTSRIDIARCPRAGDFKRIAGFQDAYKRCARRSTTTGFFAKAMQGRPVVLGYYFNSEDRAAGERAARPVLPRGSFDGRNLRFPPWVGYTGNLPAYLRSAAAAGHINPLVDDDGMTRRVPMLRNSTAPTTRRCRSPSCATTWLRDGADGRGAVAKRGGRCAQRDAMPEWWLQVGPPGSRWTTTRRR